ncbi:MAG TPA: hypothetical protein VIY08_01855 [Candidatus Nitrosocosmicus sp.]
MILYLYLSITGVVGLNFLYTRKRGRYFPILFGMDGEPTKRKYPGGLYTQSRSGRLINVHKKAENGYFNQNVEVVVQGRGDNMLIDLNS